MESRGGGCREPSEVPFVVCYPKDKCENVRILSELGVKVCDYGKREIKKFHVLGVGFRGIVFKGLWNDVEVAVKIPRADRSINLEKEGMILKIIEGLKVAPKPFYWSKNVLIMELLLGEDIVKAVERNPIYACKALCAARKLDKMGVDHGELVRPEEHVVVVNNEVKFLDFGSASLRRKVSNVTAIASALFLKPTDVARNVVSVLGINKAQLIEALREYKRRIDSDSFKKVLAAAKCPPCDVH